MTKFFTLLSMLGIGMTAMASVPEVLDVTPETTRTHSSIEEITIEYSKGYYNEIGWYTNPDIRINNVPVSGTKSVNSDETIITYRLDNPITATGEYTIFIGANSFYYDHIYEYDNPDTSWTVNVVNNGTSGGGFQPINNPGVDIIPTQGAYSDLQYFTLSFDTSYSDFNASKVCQLIKDDGSNEVIATARPSQGSGLIYQCVNFSEKITTPGTYILVCPEGTFYDMMTDEDFPEYRFRFVVEEGAPSTTPPSDNVTVTPAETETLSVLGQVVVEFVDYNDAYQNRNCTEAITIKDESGNVVANGSVELGMNGLATNEARIFVTPAITAAGVYTINVPYMYFILEGANLYDGQHSGPLTLTYTVDPSVGVESVATNAETAAKVYRIDGTQAKGELLPGMYIVNGKKVIVK